MQPEDLEEVTAKLWSGILTYTVRDKPLIFAPQQTVGTPNPNKRKRSITDFLVSRYIKNGRYLRRK